MSELCLNYALTRNTPPPKKAKGDAGWDFFVPVDLRLEDFTKNASVYSNEWFRPSDPKSPSFQLAVPDGQPMFVRFQNDDGRIVYFDAANGDMPLSQEQIAVIGRPGVFVKAILLRPGEKVLIPSGVHVRLPENVALNAENKSGVASKRGLVKLASLIDPSYQGEIHVNLLNAGNGPALIKAGEKIVQFIPVFLPGLDDSRQFTLEDLYRDFKSDRGDRAFGSTGTTAEAEAPAEPAEAKKPARKPAEKKAAASKKKTTDPTT